MNRIAGFFALLSLMGATEAYSCLQENRVFLKDINQMPVLGFVDEASHDTMITFYVYLRSTGNFEGLRGAQVVIYDNNNVELADNALPLNERISKKVYQTSITINRDLLKNSEFRIHAYEEVVEMQPTDRPMIVKMSMKDHFSYTYVFKLSEVYEVFKNNSFSIHSSQDKYEGDEMERFTKRIYNKTRTREE